MNLQALRSDANSSMNLKTMNFVCFQHHHHKHHHNVPHMKELTEEKDEHEGEKDVNHVSRLRSSNWTH